MLKVEGIGKVLPKEPYAQYESQCPSCKKSNHPTKLFFVKNGPYEKSVISNDYNVFYVNISRDDDITGYIKSSNDKKSFTSHPGQIVTIVPAGQKISYEISNNYNQAILCVHKSVLNEKVIAQTKGKYNKAIVRASGPCDSPLLSSVLKEIEQVQTGEITKDHFYLESLYDIAMTKIINYYTDLSNDLPAFKAHSPVHMKRVMDYIYQNIDKEIKVSELASIIGLSQYHFTRLFKEYLGSSPYQYILNLRFEKSKEYLIETDMSLVSIATTLGFSSQAHFQSFFKKNTGLTPREYRKNNQI